MDKYVISLNINGEDTQIYVPDLETANLLLNDNDAAIQYVRNHFPDYNNDRAACETEAQCSTNTGDVNEILWNRRKPTDIDLEATSLLLKLREDYDNLFMDKKHHNGKLWMKISEKVGTKYNLGENGAERCMQKFANLTKPYLAYIKKQKTTGEGKSDIPPFFDELYSILGAKHKIKPVLLEDSLQSVQSEDHETETDDQMEQENSDMEKNYELPSTSRFKKLREKLKPKSKFDLVSEELAKDRENRANQFKFMETHLRRTEEQRDRLLSILDQALQKKRRKTASSDSDD